ncbi:hypothetical protein EJB05_42187, partial [Eragrostis curvula]
MAADWASLPADMINLIAGRVLANDDLDYYMDFRAVCRTWRVSTADPKANPSDPRFHPRRYYLITGAAGGQLVLAERGPPHDARVLNPFTGGMIRFKAPMPDEIEVVAHVISSSPPMLVLICGYKGRHTIFFAGADDESFLFPMPHEGNRFSNPLSWTALLGGVYAAAPVISYFIVESDGETLVVIMLRHGMKVFKLNTVANVVEPVKDLGNRALFLGHSRCLSVDANKFPSVVRNCIYHVVDKNRSTLDFAVCVYNLKNKREVTLRPEDKLRLKIIALLWSWWEARNKANAGERGRDTQEITYMAAGLVNDISNNLLKAKIRAPRLKSKWSPPPPELLKINIDGAFSENLKSGAWGFIVRDHEGAAVLAGSGHLTAVHDALCSEAQAGLAALQAAITHGMSRIQLETDSTCLMMALKTEVYDHATGGLLFKEMKDLMMFHFDFVDVIAVPQSCNSVAHELARYSLGRDSDQFIVWTDPLPEFVTNLVDRDLADPSLNE